MESLCWLWPLLAGLIGLAIGWLLKQLSGGSSYKADWENCENRYRKLEAEKNGLLMDLNKYKNYSVEDDEKYTSLYAKYNSLTTEFDDYKSTKTNEFTALQAKANDTTELDKWKAKVASLETEKAELQTSLDDAHAKVENYNIEEDDNYKALNTKYLGLVSEFDAFKETKANEFNALQAKSDDTTELDKWKAKVASLETEKAELQTSLDDAHAKVENYNIEEDDSYKALNTKYLGLVSEFDAFKEIKANEFNALQAKADDTTELDALKAKNVALEVRIAEFEKATAKDDLTKIEGIGPKIAELMNNAGIHTFCELAAKDVSDIQTILDNAGSRYTVHNPGTWPKQAQMACDGNWDELYKWQDILDGGVDYSVNPDDLTKIEGIGPKIAELLNGGGIFTFLQLAKADVSRLQAILDEAGPAYTVHSPDTWPQQAVLARDGKWDELQELQDRLDGGRE